MQKVFTKFRDPVNSFPLGEMNLGIIGPGRYSGFDVIEEISGLQVLIKHNNNSLKRDINLNLVNFGSIVTQQGSIIHLESTLDEPGLNLTLDPNVIDGSPNIDSRFDYLICEHQYIQVVGGEPAIFYIQKGPLDGSLPVLSNPDKQIIIGIFEIAPGGYEFTDITYTPSPSPNVGGMNLPWASENQRGIIRLISQVEMLAESNFDYSKAITLSTLLQRTATRIRQGVTRFASVLESLQGTSTSRTMNVLDSRKFAGVSHKIVLTQRSLTIDNTNIEQYAGSILVFKPHPIEGTPEVEITIEKLNYKDISIGIINESRPLKLIQGTDVELITPNGFTPEMVDINNGLVIESDGVTNSGKFFVMGGLKPIM
jgi:hypothetical protein